MVATCKDILALNPSASDGSFVLNTGATINCDFSGSTCAQMHTAGLSADGPYTKLDGSTIYCDMEDGGTQIYGVSFGNYATAYAGYVMISLNNYVSPGLQRTFIDLFNQQSGAPLIATWSIGNCCVKYDASANMLFLGSGDNNQAYVEAGFCSATPPATAGLTVWVGTTDTAQTLPLPTNFFQMFTPSEGTECGASTNPAFFWKETP